MRTIVIVPAIAVIVVAAGCGGSSAGDKAKSQACDASADVKKQVDTLKGLPLSTSSIDKAKATLQIIGDDLKTIQGAAPKVSDQLKQQLQQANSAFEAEVQSIAQSIASAQSLSSAATALTTAGTTLQTSYQQAFANVKC
jgi:hypothetical protein